MSTGKTFVESLAHMEKVLAEERVGFLGLSRGDHPCVIPLTYGYHAGRILFHCALTGSKLDLIRANPRVSFSVARQFGQTVPHPHGAVCHVDSDSVVCSGVARIVDDLEERRKTLSLFNRCLQPGARDITIEDVSNCLAVEIELTEMTGREERDGKCTFWKYSFRTG